MKNLGLFDPAINPVIKGGLTPEQEADLEARGWKSAVTDKHLKNVDIVIKDEDSPSGITLGLFDVAPGLRYYYNPDTGEALVADCGNASCWRYLSEGGPGT